MRSCPSRFAATQIVRHRVACNEGSARRRCTIKSSSDCRAGHGTQKNDRRTDPLPIAFAPLLPIHQIRGADPSRRTPARCAHRAAFPSSRRRQHFAQHRAIDDPAHPHISATRSISIEPSAGAALTLTAANFTGFAPRAARSCRRQADNKFARTPCRPATSCTEAPANRLSATARRRCAAVHLPRGRGAADSRPLSTDSSCFDIDLLLVADHAPRQRGSLRGKNSFQGPRPHAYDWANSRRCC